MAVMRARAGRRVVEDSAELSVRIEATATEYAGSADTAKAVERVEGRSGVPAGKHRDFPGGEKKRGD